MQIKAACVKPVLMDYYIMDPISMWIMRMFIKNASSKHKGKIGLYIILIMYWDTDLIFHVKGG